MARVQPGRFSAQINDGTGTGTDEEFVVFLIGMRINKLWKLHRWIPVAMAMGPMIAELMRHPDKGMLGARTMWAGRSVTLVQYWRSFDHLEAFARDADDPHLEAWRRYNRRIGSSGDVGVWHETYRVPVANFECIYANMPVVGLAQAFQHVPVGRRGEAARERIGA